jgi:leucyl aminopeptidase
LIIGAHQDSTNLLPFLPAPGADDDGSGTVSILEAFSVLLHQGWSPAPNSGALEFMWFSAEEGGLLGSQEVARAYRNNNRVVSGMVQFDMTAFVKKGTTPSVGLVTDFVDPSLTREPLLLAEMNGMR